MKQQVNSSILGAITLTALAAIAACRTSSVQLHDANQHHHRDHIDQHHQQQHPMMGHQQPAAASSTTSALRIQAQSTPPSSTSHVNRQLHHRMLLQGTLVPPPVTPTPPTSPSSPPLEPGAPPPPPLPPPPPPTGGPPTPPTPTSPPDTPPQNPGSSPPASPPFPSPAPPATPPSLPIQPASPPVPPFTVTPSNSPPVPLTVSTPVPPSVAAPPAVPPPPVVNPGPSPSPAVTPSPAVESPAVELQGPPSAPTSPSPETDPAAPDDATAAEASQMTGQVEPDVVKVSLSLSGATPPIFESTYQQPIASITATLSGTPLHRWNISVSQVLQLPQQGRRHLLSMSLQDELVSKHHWQHHHRQLLQQNQSVVVDLWLYTRNPQLVWFRLVQPAAITATSGGFVAGCATEYCARLVAAGVPIDPNSIYISPNYTNLLVVVASPNKIAAETTAKQGELEQTRRLAGAIAGAVAGAIVLLVLVLQRKRMRACFRSFGAARPAAKAATIAAGGQSADSLGTNHLLNQQQNHFERQSSAAFHRQSMDREIYLDFEQGTSAPQGTSAHRHAVPATQNAQLNITQASPGFDTRAVQLQQLLCYDSDTEWKHKAAAAAAVQSLVLTKTSGPRYADSLPVSGSHNPLTGSCSSSSSSISSLGTLPLQLSGGPTGSSWSQYNTATTALWASGAGCEDDESYADAASATADSTASEAGTVVTISSTISPQVQPGWQQQQQQQARGVRAQSRLDPLERQALVNYFARMQRQVEQMHHRQHTSGLMK